MLLKNKMILKNNSIILRILDIKEENVFIIDCVKKTMPKWILASDLKDFQEITEFELLEFTHTILPDESDLGFHSTNVMNERYRFVLSILPYLTDTSKRNDLITYHTKQSDVSRQSLTKYLCQFLIYQNKLILAPKERKKNRTLTQHEKNFRWALNKFFYTSHQNSLNTAYKYMLLEKYCDESGNLLPDYPSFYQFRYFYRKTKKAQTFAISRHGLKTYQRNERPLLGDGVQEFAPTVGFGMFDSTPCDIYLINDVGELVGRPVLTVCVDAYSSFCYGYALTFEGGISSLRKLLSNVIANKKEWCKNFEIEIGENDWNCSQLPTTLITDQGSEYSSFVFEQLTELGVKVINLPPFRPELKGTVEKLFDIIQKQYKPFLKGKGVIEIDYHERGTHDYRQDAQLTILDFEKIIIKCILYYNNQRILKNFPYTKDMIQNNVKPYANTIFEYSKSNLGVNYLINVNLDELLLTLLPRTFGKFERNGLIVNKLRYKHSPGLVDSFFVECYLTGGKIAVAYDPDNVSYVWAILDDSFWLAKNKFPESNVKRVRYACFVLIENRYDGLSMADINDLKNAQRSIINAEENTSLQANLSLASDIVDIVQKASFLNNPTLPSNHDKTKN